MTILVFPDLHQAPNVNQVEQLISDLKPDHTVFLGDYFDQFEDEPHEVEAMAHWLVSSLSKPDRTHLIGNHDLHYLNPTATLCSGFDRRKYSMINSILTPDHWRQLKFHVFKEDYLMTHAGVSNDTAKAYNLKNASEIGAFMDQAEKDAWAILNAEPVPGEYLKHWFWAASLSRGGNSPYPGLVWCDFREFQPIAGLNQIVGHSKSGVIRAKYSADNSNFCIDTTDMHGVHHYAIVSGGEVTVYHLRSREPIDPIDATNARYGVPWRHAY